MCRHRLTGSMRGLRPAGPSLMRCLALLDPVLKERELERSWGNPLTLALAKGERKRSWFVAKLSQQHVRHPKNCLACAIAGPQAILSERV